MAVDYTKLFTVAGKYVDKVLDYYAYIATYTADQTAIETTLGAQSLVRLGDGLVDDFGSFKEDISGQIDAINTRVETLFTDEVLIGNEFAFGSSPSLSEVWPVLIQDMIAGDKNVTASVATIGTPTYATTNANTGKAATGDKLDGVTPPMAGAIAVPGYAGVVTQMTPDSETLTLTCVQDSERGGTRGAEQFSVSGTGPQSEPYSPNGESVGNLGTITVADNGAGAFASNLNFDTWSGSPESPDDWSVVSGTEGTNFIKGATAIETLTGSGFSLRTAGAGTSGFSLRQILSKSVFTRKKAFFIAAWGTKVLDTLADPTISLSIRHNNVAFGTLNVTPTQAFVWELFATQVVVPAELIGDLDIIVSASINTATHNHMILDQVVICPCEYFAGAAIAVFGGPNKFLIGDKISIALSNDSAGKFQSYFRKAFRVQLPTDATPTIADALVA